MSALRESLPDHAAEADDRAIPIDRVGIKGLAYPITVWDRQNKMQSTVARIDATVSLPADQKGTHMSRFVEVLNGVRGELSLKNLPEIVAQLQRRLNAEQVQLDVRFPYFMLKKAPVSRVESLMQYEAAFHAERDGEHFCFQLEVLVPVTTLCPCSKAVSERGAHNQRSWVNVKIRSGEFLWIEEVVEAVERCASSPLYALLKREDEKFVTEEAYDRPRFVEDLIREVVATLRPRADWLQVEVENLESIHNHSAWATLAWERPPREPPGASNPASTGISSMGAASSSPASTPAASAKAASGSAASTNGAPTSAASSARPEIGFGPWLRQRRLDRGWSQQDLAERLGVSPSLLSKVEGGERSLPEATIPSLALVLGLDLAAVQVRAGHIPAALRSRIAGDPEGFLRWAATRGTDA